ncbi:MAG: single-stranded DNA-binding protein [Planctomycetales bacterium]|nr:single-stranded DNA-binding protein [Planctomycetales bacterium]
MNLNKVFLIGRLTRDPELRYTQTGTAVAEFGLAINRKFTTADGQSREETCFVDVVLWAKRAEVASQYLTKGQPVFVEGRLELDQWQGPDGSKRSRLRVVADNFQFLSGRGREDDAEGAAVGGSPAMAGSAGGGPRGPRRPPGPRGPGGGPPPAGRPSEGGGPPAPADEEPPPEGGDDVPF